MGASGDLEADAPSCTTCHRALCHVSGPAPAMALTAVVELSAFDFE
jgi:hypothetical protein